MASSSHRYPYIDLLRGLAVVVMIEVHVFNEWLHPELKLTDGWYVLNFINGLVAPTFIFLAGFSFTIAAVRKWNDFLRVTPSLKARFRHLLLILGVGYVLHIPAYSYRTLKYWTTPEILSTFWIVDVLQVIVAGLFILHLILMISRRRSVLIVSALLFSLLLFSLSPFVNGSGFFDSWPRMFACYFVQDYGSLFPLFPWGGFLFLGAACADLFMRRQRQDQGLSALRILARGGMAALAAGVIMDAIPWFHYAGYEFWQNSPPFSLVRIGCVLLLLYLAAWLDQRKRISSSMLVLMGQESFLVYALHLMIIFSKFGTWSLATTWQGQFSVLEASLAFLVLSGAMYAVARWWKALKKRSILQARMIMGGILLIGIFVFFFFENGEIVLWILNPNDPFK